MAQRENLSLQGSAHSEAASDRQQQRKQDGHHYFGRLHGGGRRFNGINVNGVFGRDRRKAIETGRSSLNAELFRHE